MLQSPSAVDPSAGAHRTTTSRGSISDVRAQLCKSGRRRPTGLGAGRARWADGTISEAQLWPEHFDLAVTVELANGAKVNVGFSPGDSFSAEPYAYVGPFDTAGLDGEYWNAPFGAFLPYGRIDAEEAAALAFALAGLGRLTKARRASTSNR